MKRDFELIRKLLLFFEDKPDDKPVELPPIEGYSDLEIKYHLVLMDEAKFLSCEHVRSSSDPDRIIYVLPFSLTWQGHEFLDAARNETIWKRATGKLREKGLSVTIGVLQSLLVAYTKQQLGANFAMKAYPPS